MFKFMKKAKGFTLVELLIVIGVIAVLAALAFVALNPLARFQDSRNAQRWTDVNALIGAIKLQQVDNEGNYLQVITDEVSADTRYQIGTNGSDCADDCGNPTVILDDACIDLTDLADTGYLPAIPMDPSTGTAAKTGYYMMIHTSGALEVGSCNEEAGSGSAVPQVKVQR
jgi:prepilin-type N-terminal cleavage/methylation domain-containing protein